MSQRTFMYYAAQTGVLHAQVFKCTNREGWAKDVDANAPRGHRAIEGHFDYLSQKVDIATGRIVDHVPSQPSADHEWNADTKRWQLSATAASAKADRISANAEIANLVEQQHHVVREAILGYEGAKERLQAIDSQIAELRKRL